MMYILRKAVRLPTMVRGGIKTACVRFLLVNIGFMGSLFHLGRVSYGMPTPDQVNRLNLQR